MALSRAVLFSGLARYLGALQADRHWGGLGLDPPLFDDGGVYDRIWPTGGAGFGGGALSDFGLCGNAALAIFSGSLSECSNSLISNANLLSKVYFPRLVVPASAVVVSFVDFLISGSILLGLMIWYDFVPGWRIVTLPLFLLVAIAASMGCGLWLATLNVEYRDFRYIVPFIVQFGLYISPVGFSSSIVPERWRLLYSLNPMVGVIDGFRWAILGQESRISWPGFLVSLTLVLLLLISGVWYFRRMERTFADVI